jgi:hypothetical protein
MATDITIAIEKYTKEIGWQCIGYENDILGKESGLARNYGLYSILANTKEDYELIDETTTIGYIPIAEPRGIPKDADPTQGYASIPFQKDPYDRWYPNWVTLKEIVEYPHWEKKVLLKEHPEDTTGIKETYSDRCREFIDEFIPKLKELSQQPECLRLVYYFW